MMENILELIISKDKISKKSFLGAFARDELPTIEKYPSCFILNTQNRNEEGEHWMAINFDREKNCYFFDSYGMSYKDYDLTSYLKQYSKKISYNRRSLQGNSNFCGVYCILFILFVCHYLL